MLSSCPLRTAHHVPCAAIPLADICRPPARRTAGGTWPHVRYRPSSDCRRVFLCLEEGGAFSSTSKLNLRASAYLQFQNQETPCFLSSLRLSLTDFSILSDWSKLYTAICNAVLAVSNREVTEAWGWNMCRISKAFLQIANFKLSPFH